MAQTRTNGPYLRLAILFIACTGVLLLWSHTTTTPSVKDGSGSGSSMSAQTDVLAKLAIDLKQTDSSPPTIAVTVTNNHDTVLTLLNWESPLDPAAVALGVFKIVPEGASAPLDLPTITFRRVMPPPPENLITLKPGASTTETVSFIEPAVPVDQLGRKARVFCEGTWAAVWPGFTADELTPEILEKLQFGDNAITGPFKSDTIDLVVA